MNTTTSTEYRPHIGDLVTAAGDHRIANVIWTVTKVNKSTVDLDSHTPPGLPPVRADKRLVHPAETAGGAGGAQAFLTALPAVRDLPGQPLGAVVTVRDRDGYWVVVQDKFDKIRVARLGGDQNKYLTCPWQIITPVDVASILK